MITFKQYLLETMSQSVPYNWEYKNPDQWKATFSINDLDYFVIMGQDDEQFTKWDVVFDIENRPDQDEPFSISGTGNTSLVFSTILVILQEFGRKNPNVCSIIFTAEEPSRQKFYDRYAKILAHRLGNWKLKISTRGIRKYTIIRPKW